MSSRTWTIREVLDWAARDFAERGIESARLDAELLVSSALGIDRIGLYLDLDRPLLEEERGAIRPLIARRREREPVAYILGRREFYGRRFEVNRDVLVPRPDTETLIEHALEVLPAASARQVLDVGTGSGAIAITLAAERPEITVTATDISDAALAVARRNAEAHGVTDRIRFEHVDLVPSSGRYDLIVSNPPYIPSAEIETLQDEVRVHEPRAALEGGHDGLDVIRRLLALAEPATASGADLLFEIGAGQSNAVEALAAASSGWSFVATYADLNRVERVVHLRRI